MPMMRSFEGFAPPRRYDDVPFVDAIIREGAASTGPWTDIETIALSPVDADPSDPALRNFTTNSATLEDGWYIIRWVDGDAATFDSDPIRYMAGSGPASAAGVRESSKIAFGELGYPAPVSGPDPLQVLVDRSVEYVLRVTGQTADSIPETLANTYEEAIQRRTEQLAYKAQEDEAETAADFELINNFSAGSYSETRRGLGETEKQRQINPWPLLNDLLWALATEDARDEWIEYWDSAGGKTAPAFDVTEMDWNYFGPIGDYARPSDIDPDLLV